ncbi:MAG TPA: hypothetical protein VGF59_35215, partial [Bryobacteraceae bacterium]
SNPEIRRRDLKRFSTNVGSGKNLDVTCITLPGIDAGLKRLGTSEKLGQFVDPAVLEVVVRWLKSRY